MIIKPKTRGFICTTAHPLGCQAHVKEQIDFIKEKSYASTSSVKNVLIVGCSTGYGLASRIVSTYGLKANTLGVMFEKEPTEKRTASAGWYNTLAFEKAAQADGYYAKSLNVDAFSNEAKDAVIEQIKADMGKIDLVIYSLASPRRKDPATGTVYSSTLKPVGKSVHVRTLDTDKKKVYDIDLEPASDQEIADTIKVMGGEDWELWMQALGKANVLAENCRTMAFTYIGKSLTWPIYGEASIGKAKEDLDRAAKQINEQLKSLNGSANVAVLKAVVTQSSSAIPVMPLYISLLYRVMKEQGSHEGCIEQLDHLLMEQVYGSADIQYDEQQRVRVDLKELDDSVQNKVKELWETVNTDNLDQLSDFKGYQEDFFKLFGFGFKGIDYNQDIDPRTLD